MNLAKTQLFSLFTKGVTTMLGIVQSVIVIRILSPADYGLVGLVMSVGGLIGVTQHLGIVDGAIREIAVLDKKEDVGAVFWVSHLVRQMVTIPLSLGLIFLSSFIAGHIYHRPEIAIFIQLFAGVLVLQGLQDVLGASLTGMKNFMALYAIQIVTATINVAAFGILTKLYGALGFFVAVIITTAIMVILFVWSIRRDLAGHLNFPAWPTIRKYARRVMRIGAYMYIARIFFVVWQRLPMLVLGGVLAAKELGYFNMSLTFGSKLTIITAALSEVNLSWMTTLYATQKDEFKRIVTKNMHRVLLLMMTLTMVLLFFTPEILRYIIGQQYLPAEPLILITTAAFFLYCLMDIGTSSVFVPANEPRARAVIYASMVAVSSGVMGWLLLTRPSMLTASWGVLGGAALAYFITVIYTKRRFDVSLLTPQLTLFLVAMLGSFVWLFTQPALPWRLTLFLILTGYIAWEARRSNLLPEVALRVLKGPPRQADLMITCFGGAFFDRTPWTNRQQVMSRVSQKYPVLFVEPRVWLPRYIWRHRWQPRQLFRFCRRVCWYEKKHDGLYIKSQWNLIPYSREIEVVSRLNHWLNRLNVLFTARLLGFQHDQNVMWIYDTEAAEYLSAFKDALVIYDCVDDHAAQAGPNRNANKVREEEMTILKRADLVTVTSEKLFEQKRPFNKNTHLVHNAGDVTMFENGVKQSEPPAKLAGIPRPILGAVGALDSYKIDFDLIRAAATAQPEWHFVFIGDPVVERLQDVNRILGDLPNVHRLGAVPHEQVPAFVHYFDACLIPYRDNEYNAASMPLKFWEFMATGKPIVVSGLPELKKYSHLISYALSPEEFMEAIQKSLQSGDTGAASRRTEAHAHTWNKRVEALLSLLDVLAKDHGYTSRIQPGFSPAEY